MPPTSGLSPRSYAILGLLAIRDWTTYELARQMERGVGDIWTAARSMVYEEPKRLVRLGLAQASTETAGGAPGPGTASPRPAAPRCAAGSPSRERRPRCSSKDCSRSGWPTRPSQTR